MSRTRHQAGQKIVDALIPAEIAIDQAFASCATLAATLPGARISAAISAENSQSIIARSRPQSTARRTYDGNHSYHSTLRPTQGWDYQGADFLTFCCKREEACNGGSDWSSIGPFFGGFASFCATTNSDIFIHYPCG